MGVFCIFFVCKFVVKSKCESKKEILCASHHTQALFLMLPCIIGSNKARNGHENEENTNVLCAFV